MNYIKRHAESTIERLGKMYPAIMVAGPRQVGKTTVLKNLCKDHKFLSFDDIRIMQYATQSPDLFFKTHIPPVLLDEVQYVPEIFRYIKLHADQENKHGMFYMTGSQSFHLMKGATESLAGRVGILKLLGLSLREIMGKDFFRPFLPTEDFIKESQSAKPKTAISNLWNIIHKGSMPKLYTADFTDEDWAQYYTDYVSTYIEKDVRALTRIGEERAFMQFMRLLAANTSQMINFSSIASELGKEINTIKSWVSILENSGIIYILPPYHSNINKRIVKTPKVYFLDTGLCAYLSGWYSSEQLYLGAMSGAILETFVISEIIKSYRNNGHDTSMRLSFYRDKEQREIDLIIEENGTLYPIEIKKTTNPSSKDCTAFSVLAKENKKVGDGAVICSCDGVIFLDKNIRAIPIEYI